jgi:hypothetical protein
MAHQRLSTRDEDDDGIDTNVDLEGKAFNPFDDDDNDEGKNVVYTNSKDYWADLVLG